MKKLLTCDPIFQTKPDQEYTENSPWLQIGPKRENGHQKDKYHIEREHQKHKLLARPTVGVQIP